VVPHEDLSAVRLDNAVETIILGRNYGVPGFLKSAYYEILRTGGLGHRDTCDAMDEDDECLSIDPDDTPRLIRTREKLSEAWFDTLSSALHAFLCRNGVANTCPSNATETIAWTKLVYVSGMSQEYTYVRRIVWFEVSRGLQLASRGWILRRLCEDEKGCVAEAEVALWEKMELWLKL
jgi:hypothetical protein